MAAARCIYTDGHSEEVTEDEARALQLVGICEPHPGAGADGITRRDLLLHAHHTWEEAYAVLADLRGKA
jgi:hypothetical protein